MSAINSINLLLPFLPQYQEKKGPWPHVNANFPFMHNLTELIAFYSSLRINLAYTIRMICCLRRCHPVLCAFVCPARASLPPRQLTQYVQSIVRSGTREHTRTHTHIRTCARASCCQRRRCC